VGDCPSHGLGGRGHWIDMLRGAWRGVNKRSGWDYNGPREGASCTRALFVFYPFRAYIRKLRTVV
jgi:hypothetical protein